MNYLVNEMENRYTISIIVPYYNCPEKLERLLKTIPQDKRIQVIVVDDLSDKYVKEYAQLKNCFKSCEFYENLPETKNAGGARNIGIQNAKGKWVIFADADDFFVENAWDRLFEYVNNEEDIIFFSPIAQKETTGLPSNRANKYIALVRGNLTKSKCNLKDEWKIRIEWHSPCSKMIKRSLIENYKARFELVKYSNDVLFSLIVGINAKKIKVIDESIYCITEGENTLTKNNDPNQISVRLETFWRGWDYVKANVPYKYRYLFWEVSYPRYVIRRVKSYLKNGVS